MRLTWIIAFLISFFAVVYCAEATINCSGINMMPNACGGGTSFETEAELESTLTDVTDVFTNNDGSLADDDLSDNSVGDLSDTDSTTPSDKDVLVYDGVTDNRYENRQLVEADISDLGTYFDTAGRSLTGAGSTVDADAELYTRTKQAAIINPDDTNFDGATQFTFPSDVTITRIWCSTDTGTVTIQFDERAEATPNTAGTDVMTSALVCDSDTEVTTAFDNAGIAQHVPMSLDIDATSGSPTVVRIHVKYEVND